MYSASDYRSMARRALKNYWWLAVGVTLLAFAACFVVTKTVATIRPLCYLATGKTYAEACRSCNWVYTFRRLRGHSAAEK